MWGRARVFNSRHNPTAWVLIMENQSNQYGDELPWADVIMPILKSIANNEIYGNGKEAIRGVRTLAKFMVAYKDDDYFAAMDKLNENHNKKSKVGQKAGDYSASWEYHQKWLEILIELISRSGFLPVRKVEAILDMEDVIEKVEANEIQSKDRSNK